MDGREKRGKAGCSLLPSGSLYLFLCATEVRLTCRTNTICRKRVGVGLVTHCLGQVRSCRHLETRKSATGVAEVPKKAVVTFAPFVPSPIRLLSKVGKATGKKFGLHVFSRSLDLDTSADVAPIDPLQKWPQKASNILRPARADGQKNFGPRKGTKVSVFRIGLFRLEPELGKGMSEEEGMGKPSRKRKTLFPKKGKGNWGVLSVGRKRASSPVVYSITVSLSSSFPSSCQSTRREVGEKTFVFFNGTLG